MNRKIQFTHEIESNNSIINYKINYFLYLSIPKNNNKLVTYLLSKSTFSGRFLNFKSQHPSINKKGIFNLVDKTIFLIYPKFPNDNSKIVVLVEEFMQRFMKHGSACHM